MFESEKEIEGVMQREFSVAVNGEDIPCVVYARKGAVGSRPLILMGHGGHAHKKILIQRTQALRYAQELDWAVLAIDAPGHGDRVSKEEAARLADDLKQASGNTPGGFLPLLQERTATGVAEWRAALDETLKLDFIQDTDSIGYWGVSMGTLIGVPFVASEPRIRCAVFGLLGLWEGATTLKEAAAKIEVPVEFVFQWEDEIAPREAGIALFDTFASSEKSMHINPGAHADFPGFEIDSWMRFFQRHLLDSDSIPG